MPIVSKNSPLFISHRLKGFDAADATPRGLYSAINAGITAIEIDLRITKDKQIIINHDSHLFKQFGIDKYIAALTLYEIEHLQPNIAEDQRVLSLLHLFEIIASSSIYLFLDIKEYGYEVQIIKLIDSFGLSDRVTIVSWLPESLLKVHEIAPTLPLCFSHYPINNYREYLLRKTIIKTKNYIDKKVTNRKSPEQIEFHFNNYNRVNFSRYDAFEYRGNDYEHFVIHPLKGKLADVISASAGYICIHRGEISKPIIKNAAAQGFRIMCYGIVNESHINQMLKHDIDALLIDSPIGLLHQS